MKLPTTLYQGMVHMVDLKSRVQDLETGCPKLAIGKFLGVLFIKGDYNILRLQP